MLFYMLRSSLCLLAGGPALYWDGMRNAEFVVCERVVSSALNWGVYLYYLPNGFYSARLFFYFCTFIWLAVRWPWYAMSDERVLWRLALLFIVMGY